MPAPREVHCGTPHHLYPPPPTHPHTHALQPRSQGDGEPLRAAYEARLQKAGASMVLTGHVHA